MQIAFSKYQGAGNDFIMLDNRDGQYDALTLSQIQFLCDRRFGIGADGLIKINTHPTLDFEADYYNADGSKSFCGNGGRCAVSFSNQLGIPVTNTSFLGYDGKHNAQLIGSDIHLQMSDVQNIKQFGNDYEINTGSPHYVRFLNSINDFDIFSFGQSIRYNETYKNEGINVNVVEIIGNDHLFVRTYERGVENETLACGTGVTACALAYASKFNKIGDNHIQIKVMGGNLSVRFHYDGTHFTSIWLIGPGTFVFEGEITI
ncbi:MAG: diaminopimelate epimerase [Crocinitomicaceae bacterium]|nr:diaminopimelate epimerase [Crocinitomicaceae bacterium]